MGRGGGSTGRWRCGWHVLGSLASSSRSSAFDPRPHWSAREHCQAVTVAAAHLAGQHSRQRGRRLAWFGQTAALRRPAGLQCSRSASGSCALQARSVRKAGRTRGLRRHRCWPAKRCSPTSHSASRCDGGAAAGRHWLVGMHDPSPGPPSQGLTKPGSGRQRTPHPSSACTWPNTAGGGGAGGRDSEHAGAGGTRSGSSGRLA